MPHEIISTPEALAALVPEWDALWRATPTATPFQSTHWTLPWLERFGIGGELAIVASRTNGALTTVAPLYILRDEDTGESLGMLLGSGNTDYLDVVGGDDVFPALATLDCQLWDLQQLRPTSVLATASVPDGLTEINAEDHDRCPILPLDGAGDELEGLISTHFRKKIRYYRRALGRDAEVAVETANDANLDELLNALYELHAARWKQRGLPGVLADDVTQDFHRDVARRMLGAGALRMYAIRRNGTIVAVFYGFAHGETVYYYLSGYDPALEKQSIGTILVAHAIEQAVRDGATIFDFLRGAEEYKYAWGAVDRVNRRRQLVRS